MESRTFYPNKQKYLLVVHGLAGVTFLTLWSMGILWLGFVMAGLFYHSLLYRMRVVITSQNVEGPSVSVRPGGKFLFFVDRAKVNRSGMEFSEEKGGIIIRDSEKVLKPIKFASWSYSPSALSEIKRLSNQKIS